MISYKQHKFIFHRSGGWGPVDLVSGEGPLPDFIKGHLLAASSHSRWDLRALWHLFHKAPIPLIRDPPYDLIISQRPHLQLHHIGD